MALFESYERRINQINKTLNEYGIASIEEAKAICDAKGNVVSSDNQTMTAKAGFFDKIIAFFKKIFGSTKIIVQNIDD